jgi:hypothetical protein
MCFSDYSVAAQNFLTGIQFVEPEIQQRRVEGIRNGALREEVKKLLVERDSERNPAPRLRKNGKCSPRRARP